jgi:hypothetical protein
MKSEASDSITDSTIHKLISEVNALRLHISLLEHRIEQLESREKDKEDIVPGFSLDDVVKFHATDKTPGGYGRIVGITGGQDPFLVLEDTRTKKNIKRKPTSVRKLLTTVS